jgi:hypothetical protein
VPLNTSTKLQDEQPEPFDPWNLSICLDCGGTQVRHFRLRSFVLVKIPGEPPFYGIVQGFGAHGHVPYLRIGKGGADSYEVSLDHVMNA